MDELFFKCRACGKYIRIEREPADDFAQWAYYGSVEWPEFRENVPELSAEHRVPEVGRQYTLRVSKPFDESVGNEFLTLYESAAVCAGGWYGITAKDLEECAVVRCRFTEILERSEYEARIVVRVEEVVPLDELSRRYETHITERDLDVFEGIPGDMCELLCECGRWSAICWDAQGDCGEERWFYTDENGIRRLVMQSWFDFDQSIMFLGNIVRKPAGE